MPPSRLCRHAAATGSARMCEFPAGTMRGGMANRYRTGRGRMFTTIRFEIQQPVFAELKKKLPGEVKDSFAFLVRCYCGSDAIAQFAGPFDRLLREGRPTLFRQALQVSGGIAPGVHQGFHVPGHVFLQPRDGLVRVPGVFGKNIRKTLQVGYLGVDDASLRTAARNQPGNNYDCGNDVKCERGT